MSPEERKKFDEKKVAEKKKVGLRCSLPPVDRLLTRTQEEEAYKKMTPEERKKYDAEHKGKKVIFPLPFRSRIFLPHPSCTYPSHLHLHIPFRPPHPSSAHPLWKPR